MFNQISLVSKVMYFILLRLYKMMAKILIGCPMRKGVSSILSQSNYYKTNGFLYIVIAITIQLMSCMICYKNVPEDMEQ